MRIWLIQEAQKGEAQETTVPYSPYKVLASILSNAGPRHDENLVIGVLFYSQLQDVSISPDIKTLSKQQDVRDCPDLKKTHSTILLR